MIQLAIGIPTHGELKADMAACLLSLTHSLPYPTVYLFAKGTYVHKNRNELVDKAKELKATHLLFIDSDMLFSHTDIVTLVDQKKPIIGANYNRREFPLKRTVEYDGELPKKTFVCDSIATGFMLIDMKVFEKLKKPYFHFEYDGERMMGEDVYFCRRAREAGFKIWCDPTIAIKHLGEYPY